MAKELNNSIEKVVNFYDKIIDARDEESAGGKKIVLTEYVGIGGSGLGLLSVISNLDEIGDELAELSSEDIETAVSQFESDFNHPNPKVKAMAVRSFRWVLNTYDYYQDLKDIKAAHAESGPPHGGGEPGGDDD